MASQRAKRVGILALAVSICAAGTYLTLAPRSERGVKSLAPAAVPPPEAASATRNNREIPRVDLTDGDPAVVRAIQLAQDEVKKSPAAASAWAELGMVLSAHEFNDAACAAFAAASELQPDDARWPYLRARSFDLGDSEEMIPPLEKAVAICGDRPDAPVLTLIEVLIAVNRLPEGEQRVTQFLRSHPENARANLAMGRLQLRKGDLVRASEHARMAERNPAAHKTAHELLAQVLLRQGNKPESQQHRQQAAAATESAWPDPYYEEVLAHRTGLKASLVRADKLFGKGDVNATIPLLRQTIREYPESDWAHVLLGRSLVRSRQLPEAERILKRAVELAPQSVEAQFRLGVAVYLQKRHQEAAEWFRKAIAQKPDFTMAHYNLGYCLKDMGDIAGAIQAFESAAAMDPNNFDAHVNLAMLLANERRFDESRAHWRRAVELRPADRHARQQLERLPAGSGVPLDAAPDP